MNGSCIRLYITALIVMLLIFIAPINIGKADDYISTAGMRSLVYATRTTQFPKIDGKLDDACWKSAGEIPAFIRADVGDIALASQRTQAWLLYDDKNLYIAMRCQYDNIAELVATRKPTQRDGQLWYDDCVEVFLDAKHSRVEYYHIIVNPLGAVYDAGPNGDTAWSSDVKVKTAKTKDSWIVEMAIPLNLLDVSAPKVGAVWGINLTRHFHGKKSRRELSSLAYIGFGGFHKPSQFADLLFASADAPGLTISSLGKLGGGENELNGEVFNHASQPCKMTFSASLVPGNSSQDIKLTLNSPFRKASFRFVDYAAAGSAV